MGNRYLVLMFTFLLLAVLACSALDGGTSEPEIQAEATAVATPTLAPTIPPDQEVQATDSSGDSNEDPDGSDNGESETISEATPDPGADNSESGAVNGDSGSTEESSDNGEPAVQQAACPAGGTNLLLNPSFEGQFKPYGAINELNHAPNWFPWWKDGQNNLRPEFKPAEASLVPNRVHSGNTAQQYFKSFGQFKAGLFQSVLDVPPGQRLQFSAYGQAWSCQEFNMCPDGTSVNPANMLMRVGIDPTGDTNFEADTVVWSEYFNPLDQWQVACVSAVSERDIVTVYLWASPDGPRQNQDIYWDDASLVVIP